jgi:hypothetical protein
MSKGSSLRTSRQSPKRGNKPAKLPSGKQLGRLLNKLIRRRDDLEAQKQAVSKRIRQTLDDYAEEMMKGVSGDLLNEVSKHLSDAYWETQHRSFSGEIRRTARALLGNSWSPESRMVSRSCIGGCGFSVTAPFDSHFSGFLCTKCKNRARDRFAKERDDAHQSREQHRAYVDHLKSLPYSEYLKTDHWQSVRKMALYMGGHECALCTSRGPRLDVHHRTYKNLGDERPDDLTVLCRECHKRHHNIGKGIK